MTSIYSTWTEPRKLDTNLEGDMGKYTEQTKLTATEDYCGGHSSLKTVARRHSVDISSLRKWVAVYKMHGATALKTKEKKCHSVEFKLSVLKRVRDEGLSLRLAGGVFLALPQLAHEDEENPEYRGYGLVVIVLLTLLLGSPRVGDLVSLG